MSVPAGVPSGPQIAPFVGREHAATTSGRREAAHRNRRSRQRLRRLCRPSPRLVVLAAAAFAVDQALYQLVGSSIALQAPLDETAHVFTTLLILWSLTSVGERVLVPALVASVVIDVDHIPHEIGAQWLTAGTARPYTHSLLTIVVLLALAAASRRSSVPVLAVALGVASHLWRDLAEPAGAGVSLLWPASDRTYHLPAALYLGAVAALAVVALARALRRGGASPSDLVR